MDAGTPATLQVERHIKYWKRCHSSYLPAPYVSADSIRLTLACFIISALDLLHSPLSTDERRSIRRWVLSLQHPDGGFCGSSTHAHDGAQGGKGTANLAATYFALVLLALAAGCTEDQQRMAFDGVKRKKLLIWLRRLQSANGSFGQVAWDGEPAGGDDVRHGYMAAGIRWMLRGDVKKGDKEWVEDIEVDALRKSVVNAQTYDGGIGESMGLHESHGGYTFCGVAALALLDRPQQLDGEHSAVPVQRDITNNEALLRFLALRQFGYLSTEETEDDAETENYIEKQLGDMSLEETVRHVGFNGRWNKKADTCYAWWTGGSLSIIDKLLVVNEDPSRKYLLEVTQHIIGGFSKSVGGPPDINHSYMGLAALSILHDKSIKELDVELCCTMDTTRSIVHARDGLLSREAKSVNSWDDGFWN